MSRWRWKPVRERNPIVVAIVGFIIFGIIGLAAYNANNLPIIGGGTTYSADFNEAAGLRPGNEVRVAGVKVGTVSSVTLDHAQVKVVFRVKNTWVGNASTVSIEIRTVLGDKYLAIDPLGDGKQDPSQTIALNRTTSPYDITQAFQDLSSTAGQLDTASIAKSLEALSATFKGTPGTIREALTGLSAISTTLASRDADLQKLLDSTAAISKTVSDEDATFATLLTDGNTLLAEVQARETAISTLLTGTEALSGEVIGLINDNNAQLGPTLKALNKVTTLLENNRDNLNRALALAGPYTRLLGNALGNGRWMDAYLCGLVPNNYLPAGSSSPKSGCMPNRSGGK